MQFWVNALMAALAIVLTWLVLALTFASIGALYCRRFVDLLPSFGNLWLTVLIGFSLSISGLLLWHFFLPVNGTAVSAFLAISLLSLVLERRWWNRVFRHPISVWPVLLVAVFSLWTANHALAPGKLDDLWYEVAAVRWYHDYPVIPGLANLNGRIGFNNSHHLLCALLASTPWRGGVNHLFNGFFLVLLFGAIVFSFRSFLRPGSVTSSAERILPAYLGPVIGHVLFGLLGMSLSTLKVDSAVTIIAFVSTFWLFMLFESQGRPEWAAYGSVLILLGATAVTLKLSSIFFCGIVLSATLAYLVFGWRTLPRRSRFFLLTSFGIASLTIGSFILRGILLSGYPAYPSTLMAASIDWRVPVRMALAEQVDVTAAARLQIGYNYADLARPWFANWASQTVVNEKFTLLLPLILILTLGPYAVWTHRHPSWRQAAPHLILIVASISAAVACFRLAPAARFAEAYFWIPAACVIAAIQTSKRELRLVPVSLVLGCSMGMGNRLSPPYRVSGLNYRPS